MYFMSVIVPVFNVAKYLRRCVESLIRQEGFDKVEVLLIDDGSSDPSGAICDEFSVKYRNIITIHKSNGGLSDARNTGIANAHGKYLAFLDSDDLAADTFIKDMLDMTEQYQPQMVCFGYVFEKKEGIYTFTGDKSVSKRSRDGLIGDLLKLKMGNQICFNIYSAELFEGIGFPAGRAYEDIATLYRLILRTDHAVTVNYSYYVYNVANSGSITKNTTMKNMTDMYKAVQEQCSAISAYYEEHGMDREYLDYYKLNELLYIYVKVKREIAPGKYPQEEPQAFLSELENGIDQLTKERKVSIKRYRHYDLRKYLYYKVTHMFKGKGQGDANGSDR